MTFYCPSLEAECRNVYATLPCNDCPYFREELLSEV